MNEPTVNIIDLMGEILVLPDGTSRTIIDHERAKRFIASARESALEDAAKAIEAAADSWKLTSEESGCAGHYAEVVRALKATT